MRGTDPRSLTEWEISLAAAVHILNELSGTSRPPPAEVPLEKAWHSVKRRSASHLVFWAPGSVVAGHTMVREEEGYVWKQD